MTTPEGPGDRPYGAAEQPAAGHQPYSEPPIPGMPYNAPQPTEPPDASQHTPYTPQQSAHQPAAGQQAPYSSQLPDAGQQGPYTPQLSDAGQHAPHQPDVGQHVPYAPQAVPPQPYYPPPAPPGPYQQPYGYQPYVLKVSTNGLAIASMVLGICWVYWIGSILALVFGYVARDQIKRTGQQGDGMAIAGIVLGWVGIAFLLLAILSWSSILL